MRHPAWFMWERGISVVPVPAPSFYSDGKRPKIRWAQYQERLPTEGEMAHWFNGYPENYAVICGKVSGIVVVDIDDRSALPWARWNLVPTPWVVQTARGWHWYYSYAGEEIGNRAKLAGMKLDVRGNGGYVIGPGSSHLSGARYRAADRRGWRVNKARLPVFDAAILASAPARRAVASPKRLAAGVQVERARRYLERVPCPLVGYGSDAATFGAACRLVRGFGLSPADTLSLLSAWAPTFDAEWLESKISAATRYGSEPIGSRL